MVKEKKEKTEPETTVSKVLKTLKETSESIHIGRVPIQTKRDFKELADTEFCSDYGMTLKFLMDGIPKADILELLERITVLEDRLNTLENKPKEKEESKKIKLVNGKVVKRK